MTVTAIEQIDAVLAEDNRTVVLYGHTASADETLITSITLPIAIDPATFLPEEWSEAKQLTWKATTKCEAS